MRTFAICGVEVSEIGIASGHLVKRSMMVSRWVQPLDEGKGPTKSVVSKLRPADLIRVALGDYQKSNAMWPFSFLMDLR